MESIVNYSSEDGQDSGTESKARDTYNSDASSRRSGTKKTLHDDAAYENVRMDLNEDSNDKKRNKLKSSKRDKTQSDKDKKKEESSANNDSGSRYKSREHGKNYHHRNRRDRERECGDRDRDRDRERSYDVRDRSASKSHQKDDSVSKRHRYAREETNNRSVRNDYKERDDSRDRDRDHDHRSRNRDYKSRSDRNYKHNESVSKDQHRSQELSAKEEIKKEKDTIFSKSRSPEHKFPSPKPSISSHQNDTVMNKSEKKSLSFSTSPPALPLNESTVSESDSKSESVITLPSYYNPNIINPNKYAEQVQKRKLLWSNKKTDDVANKWGKPTFAQDTDGKVASKFMRLMGIKSMPTAEERVEPVNTTTDNTSESIKKREEMFSSMEQQYEVARQVTHTMRGVGLGFGSQPRQF